MKTPSKKVVKKVSKKSAERSKIATMAKKHVKEAFKIADESKSAKKNDSPPKIENEQTKTSEKRPRSEIAQSAESYIKSMFNPSEEKIDELDTPHTHPLKKPRHSAKKEKIESRRKSYDLRNRSILIDKYTETVDSSAHEMVHSMSKEDLTSKNGEESSESKAAPRKLIDEYQPNALPKKSELHQGVEINNSEAINENLKRDQNKSPKNKSNQETFINIRDKNYQESLKALTPQVEDKTILEFHTASSVIEDASIKTKGIQSQMHQQYSNEIQNENLAKSDEDHSILHMKYFGNESQQNFNRSLIGHENERKVDIIGRQTYMADKNILPTETKNKEKSTLADFIGNVVESEEQDKKPQTKPYSVSTQARKKTPTHLNNNKEGLGKIKRKILTLMGISILFAICMSILVVLSFRIYTLGPKIIQPSSNDSFWTMSKIFRRKEICWGDESDREIVDKTRNCTWKKCPKGASCINGNIYYCPRYFNISSKGCQPGHEIMEFVNKAKNQLKEMQLKYNCSKGPYPSLPLPDETAPDAAQFFKYYLLEGKFSETFLADFLGMSFELSKQLKSQVNVPLACLCKITLLTFVRSHSKALLSWLSCLTFIVLLLVIRGRNFRRQVLIVRGTNNAYQYIIGYAKEYGFKHCPTNHIKMIVMEKLKLPGNPKFSKKEYDSTIWSGVEKNFNKDIRIRKASREYEGEHNVTCWRWIPVDTRSEIIPKRNDPQPPWLMIGGK